jgi:CheY-like chemotaxis protein
MTAISILSQFTVLFVDDMPELLEIYENQFKKYFANLLTATSALAAIEILRKNHVDCIVTDFQMPEMNGIDFINYVQKDFKNIPVILLTGNGHDPLIINALEDGLFDYVEKPHREEVLLNRVCHSLLMAEATELIEGLIQSQFPEIFSLYQSEQSLKNRMKNFQKIKSLVKTKLLAKQSKKAA